MSKPAITTIPDAPIARAAALMHTHHVKRLPVVDPDDKLIGMGGTLIGIVSRRACSACSCAPTPRSPPRSVSC